MITQSEAKKKAKRLELQKRIKSLEEDIVKWQDSIDEEYAKVKDHNASYEVTQWAIDRIEGLKSKIKSAEGQIRKSKIKLGE